MADLEKDLSLKIEANANEAAKALDGLINRLRTLNQSLNLGNLNNFSRQLSQIASAASKIDGSAIKGFASSINALNKAQDSLKDSNQLKAVADQATNVKQKIHDMSVELAAGTRNSTQVAKELEKQLTAVFNIESKRGSDDSTQARIASNKAIDASIASMSNLIQENMKFSKSNLEAYDTYSRLRDYIAHSKIKVPTEDLGKFETIASSMSIIGRKNLSTKEGQEFGSWIKELIEEFGELADEIDITANRGTQFLQLAEYLRKCKEESASITQNWSAAEKADMLGHIPVEVAETTDKIQQLARENKSFESAFDSAPYQGINNALASLQGISLPDFGGLTVLANGLERLQKIDASKIQAISNALNGLSVNINVGNGGLDGIVQSAQSVGETAPEVKQAAEAMNEMADSMTKVGEQVNPDGVQETAEAFGNLKDNIASPTDAKNVADGFDKLGDAANNAGDGVDNLSNKQNKQKSANINLLASLVALGHELERVASTFDRWGNAGITLLKKVFLPLNVAFKGFKEKVAGMATAMKNLRTSMQKHLDKMSAFWKRAMKTFTFMLVRKAITAILNETKSAIDSLARWSNMFGTQFNTSMSEIVADATYLARSIVAIFEPIINAVVPILNMLVDALGRAARALAEFFAAFTGQSYFMVAKKKVGNYAAELDKANKKQKQLTMGIDELNILNEGDSGSGNGDGAGFGDEWDTAPVSDKMKKFADDIKKLLEKLFDPLKKAWDIAGDYVLGGFKYMKEEIGKLLASIGEDFLEVWNQPETVKMLTNLLYILGDIEYTIGNLAKGFREAWDEGEKGKKIFEAIRDILAILIQHVRNVTLYMRGWSQNIDFNPLLEKALELLQKMSTVAEFFGGVFEDIMKNVVLEYIEFLIEEGIPHLLDTIGEIIDSFDFEKLRSQLVPLEQSFEGVLENIDTGITNAIGNVGKAVGEFTQSEDFQKFLDNVQWFMDQITAERVEKLFTALGLAITNIAEALVKFVGSDQFKDFMQKLLDWFDSKSPEEIADGIDKIAMAIAGFKFAGFVGKGVAGFTSFLSVLASAKSAIGILTGLGSAGTAAGAGTAAAGAGGTAAAGGLSAMSAAIAPIAAAIGVAVLAVKSFVDSFGGIEGAANRLKESFKSIGDHVKGFADRLNISDKIQAVSSAFSDLMSHLGDMKDFWNALLGVFEIVGKVIGDVLVVGFNSICTAVQGAIEILDGIIEVFGGLGKVIMGLIEGDFPKVEEGFMQILYGFEDLTHGLYDLLIQPFVDIVNGIIELFKYLYDVLLGHSIIPDIIDGIVKGFSGMISTVVNAVKNFVTKIVNFFKDLWSKVVDRVTNLKDDIISKWTETKAKVEENVRLLKDSIVQKWEETKSKVEEKIRLLKESIIQKWEEIKSRIQEKVQQIKDDLIAKWDQIKADAERLLKLVKDAIIQPFKDVWDSLFGADGWITKTVGELVKKWEQMKKDATELLGKVKDAIVQPFKDAWNALFGEEGVISSLVSKFKKGLGEISPDMITEKLKGVGDAIVAPFKSAYEAAMGENGWVSQLLKGINSFFDGIKTAIENSPLGKFFENIADKIKGLKEKLDGLKSDAKEAESSTRTSSTQGYFNGGIVQYATGGYPSRGTLFWAGEYGLPEMIGTVGGRTAVASSAEITGIRESVMESSIAEQNMMGQMINLLQAIAAKDLSVNMDSRELVSSLNDRARRNGYNFQMA